MKVNEIKAFQEASLAITGIKYNRTELMEFVHFIRAMLIQRNNEVSKPFLLGKAEHHQSLYMIKQYKGDLFFGTYDECAKVQRVNDFMIDREQRYIPNTTYKKQPPKETRINSFSNIKASAKLKK